MMDADNSRALEFWKYLWKVWGMLLGVCGIVTGITGDETYFFSAVLTGVTIGVGNYVTWIFIKGAK